MYRLKAIVLTIAIMVVGGAVSQVAYADTAIARPVTVILVDRQGLAESEGGTELAQSFLSLISTLREGRMFVYISANDPDTIIGPTQAGTPRFQDFMARVKASLAESPSAEPANMVDAMSRTYSFLTNNQARSGTEVYVLTGGNFDSDLARFSDRLALTLNMYEVSNWPIHGVSVPGADQQTGEFLNRAASGSGGQVFELSSPDGLQEIASHLLSSEAEGSLYSLGSNELSPNEIMTTTLSVPPGTQQARMLFFKEGGYGSLRLKNPSGFEASEGDREVSSVVETEHLVIWTLVEPMAGEWQVEIRGMEGAVTAWQSISNTYSINLASYKNIPVDETTTLTAYVFDGESPVALEGVTINATVINPEGNTVSLELNDAGVDGDAKAGDHFYSASMPPLGAEGQYTVDLALSWPDSNYSITSETTLNGQHFPQIEITPVETEGLALDERTKIATAIVHVNEQPYAVPVDSFTSAVASSSENTGQLEVTPQNLLQEGRAWAFDIFYTPDDGGMHTLSFGLNMEYAGRTFTHNTGAMTVSSDAPPAPADASANAPSGPALPLELLAIPGAIAALALAGVVYWFTRPQPYGYLYTDRNELVADFRRIKRPPLKALFSKNAVTGDELDVQGLEHVSFKFYGSRIGLNSQQVTPTIRVNNQPLIGETTIQDKTWIGAAGRLYSFLLSPPSQQQPEPSVGGDD